MRAPDFWQRGRADWRSGMLLPFSWIYAWKTAQRIQSGERWKAPFPVISVGNIGAGGSGKTPVVIALSEQLRQRGFMPHVVLRGYGGNLTGPMRVDVDAHTFRDVGDEALLHAVSTPTWVSQDRKLGVQAAIADGADVIVLDDAHQNPKVDKSLSLVVIDAEYGLGNERVIPAGPLREPAQAGFARADAVVVIGSGSTDTLSVVPTQLPRLDASFAEDQAHSLKIEPAVFAFAGIGRPQKFFDTLEHAGHRLAGTRSFADHHVYSALDIAELRATASSLNAQLVTTTKDWVRLPLDVRKDIFPFSVRVVWRDETILDALLEKTLSRGTQGR